MNTSTQSPASQPVNRLEPFFFGPENQHLYGCYHEPGVWPAREQAVLICYPFGLEYIRAHRACQHLATTIAAAGFPAMRFDYFGTGDSSGESNEATLSQWLEDIDAACDELINRSGASSVVLVGLRLGASLALKAARRSDVAGAVLWEPIFEGQRYVDELKQLHAETIARFFVAPTDYVPLPRPTELLGFTLGDEMLTELEALELRAVRVPRGRRIVVIDNSETSALEPAANALGKAAAITYRHVPSFAAWVDDVDKGLVPHAVIEAITVWLNEVFA